MKEPFGHTGSRVPLIMSDASPLPTLPKTKFESFDWMSWFAGGYTTLIAKGPVTRGTSGSEGFTDGTGARSTTGGGAGAAGPGSGVGAVVAGGAAQAATAAA